MKIALRVVILFTLVLGVSSFNVPLPPTPIPNVAQVG